MNRETRVVAIAFDLKQAIEDLIHEPKGHSDDVRKLKEITGLK